MMSIETAELTPRLIRLFYSAGLLEQAEWASYVESHERHKPILNVLTQEVSLGTFKDLFNAEITLKRKPQAANSALHQTLVSSSLIDDQELAQWMGLVSPTPQALVEAMRQDDAIDEQAAARALQRAKLDHSLVEDGLLSAAMVNDWLSDPANTAMRNAALYLCLCVFMKNQVLDEATFRELVALIDKGQSPQVKVRLASQFKLDSAGIDRQLKDGMGLPQALLSNHSTPEGLLEKFPQGMIRRHMIFPYEQTGQVLRVATTDPFNVSLVALMRWMMGQWPELNYETGRNIIDRINTHYGSINKGETPVRGTASRPPAVRKAPGATAAKGASAPSPAARVESREIVADNVSAVGLVSTLIESAIELRTTDIHIEPTRQGLTVRFRIDGDLHRIMQIPEAMAQPVVSRIKVLANMDVTERRRPQDGQFDLRLEDRHFDFRISSLPAIQGEKVVIRLLDTSQVMTGLTDLGLLPKQQQLIEWMLDRPFGMLLVTGPTGSGKTSTLYTALQRLNQEKSNLVTIEDPVEYQLEGINQVQVDTNINMTFSEGLRSILRQDPDVIMVGEIRDADTANIAIRAAMTGHLVLSTLHTNTAVGAVGALQHLGANPFMVSASLLGLISQRLVRRLCEQCKKPRRLNAKMARQMDLPENSRKRIYRPHGCDECFGSGFRGRTGIFEVIRVTEAMRQMITDPSKRLDDLERCAREEGLMSLYEAGLQKVFDGETTLEEMTRKVTLDI